MAVGIALALGLAMTVAPIVIAIALARRWRVPWTVFGAGALAFVASKVVQIPAMQLLSWVWLAQAGLSPVLTLAAVLPFAPLCEETARWVGFRMLGRSLAQSPRGYRDAVFFGLGHGGAEMTILCGLSFLNLAAAAAGVLPHDVARTVLFLDEPTSGLDPSAAEEVRALGGELRSSGRTIVLTTHCLAEAEPVADRVGNLATRLLELDTVEALRRRLFGHRVRIRLSTAADRHRVLDRLAETAGIVRVEPGEPDAPDIVVVVDDPNAVVPRVVRALVAENVDVRSIADVTESLEDVYLDVISRARPGARTDGSASEARVS